MMYEEVEEVFNFSLKEILKCMNGKVGVVRTVDEKGERLLLMSWAIRITARKEPIIPKNSTSSVEKEQGWEE